LYVSFPPIFFDVQALLKLANFLFVLFRKLISKCRLYFVDVSFSEEK
jgi:hypothetical protein